MVARVRLELTTYRVWTDCSSQLSYLAIMVGMTGFEPATPWSQIKYTTKLCYIPNGAPSRSRTRNLLIRSQMLYPVELSAHSVLSPCFLIVFHSPRNYKSFSEKSIVKTMKKIVLAKYMQALSNNCFKHTYSGRNNFIIKYIGIMM